MKKPVFTGFTLLETVFSVAVIAVILVMLAALVQTLPLITLSKDRDVALKVARDTLESLRGGGYDALPASGAVSNSLLSTIPSGAATRTISVYNAKTKQVTVSVTWTEPPNATAHSVSLTTLVTSVGGL